MMTPDIKQPTRILNTAQEKCAVAVVHFPDRLCMALVLPLQHVGPRRREEPVLV